MLNGRLKVVFPATFIWAMYFPLWDVEINEWDEIAQD